MRYSKLVPLVLSRSLILNVRIMKNNPFKIGLLLGSMHFFVVVLFDIVIKLALKTYPESGFLWFLVAFVDLPVEFSPPLLLKRKHFII